MPDDESKFTSTLKHYQPIAWTGALRHCFFWATRPLQFFSKKYYQNKFYLTNENPSAIYVIHATADVGRASELLASRLATDLHPEIEGVYAPSFSKRFRGTSIDEYARQLRETIKTNGHKRVRLIGHSRGGLVAAYFAEYLAADDITVESVYTLGTPFKGSHWSTPFAWVASENNSISQMRPRSQFLQNLCQRVLESKVSYEHYSPEKDWLVPTYSAHPSEEEKPENFHLIKRHAHLSLPGSRKLVKDLQQRINTSIDTNYITPEIKSEAAESISSDYTQIAAITAIFSGVTTTACILTLAGVTPSSKLGFILFGLNLIPIAGQIVALLILGSVFLAATAYLISRAGNAHKSSSVLFTGNSEPEITADNSPSNVV